LRCSVSSVETEVQTKILINYTRIRKGNTYYDPGANKINKSDNPGSTADFQVTQSDVANAEIQHAKQLAGLLNGGNPQGAFSDNYGEQVRKSVSSYGNKLKQKSKSHSTGCTTNCEAKREKHVKKLATWANSEIKNIWNKAKSRFGTSAQDQDVYGNLRLEKDSHRFMTNQHGQGSSTVPVGSTGSVNSYP
jgi:hypothetical protein